MCLTYNTHTHTHTHTDKYIPGVFSLMLIVEAKRQKNDCELTASSNSFPVLFLLVATLVGVRDGEGDGEGDKEGDGGRG